MLAVQADGCHVQTIEGVSEGGEIADLQRAFRAENALQCGFCTPGMLLTACELLRRVPRPDETTIREAIAANYCRCTGYHAIVQAFSMRYTRWVASRANLVFSHRRNAPLQGFMP